MCSVGYLSLDQTETTVARIRLVNRPKNKANAIAIDVTNLLLRMDGVEERVSRLEQSRIDFDSRVSRLERLTMRHTVNTTVSSRRAAR